MNNKTMGNSFELMLGEILSHNGFWVHLLNANKSGQPADIIAVKNHKAYLIDAKVCSHNKFPLSRIEENQWLAMDLWKECGNGLGWFALKIQEFDPQIYMISNYLMSIYKERCQILNAQTIKEIGTPIEDWVKKCK